jgi:hypothetical protein
MTKKDQEELDSTIEALETENDDSAEREEELSCIIERLCDMDDRDYRKFVRYMRCERRARKHLGSMSSNA